MKTIVFFIPFLFTFWILSAQTVSNVTVEQVDKTIHVSYDLDKQAEISLHLSIDGGKTYTELHKLSGDVGKNVAEGHKTIVWDVLAERESLVGDNIVFKVRAQVLDNLTFMLNGVTFKMIYVKGGTFAMGCTSEQGRDCYNDEKPSHTVTVSDFYIGETEVTQALWEAVMESPPIYIGGWKSKYGKGSDYPAYGVGWEQCREFCTRLNNMLSGQLPSGYRFALPSEAQWEYAARGGSKSRGYKYSGSNSLRDVAWSTDDNSWTAYPVKGKQANELGLYDMSGNVWEWCSDWFGSYNNSSQTNPTGPSSGTSRVFRGGSSGCDRFCRVSQRNHFYPDRAYSAVGFRICIVR